MKLVLDIIERLQFQHSDRTADFIHQEESYISFLDKNETVEVYVQNPQYRAIRKIGWLDVRTMTRNEINRLRKSLRMHFNSSYSLNKEQKEMVKLAYMMSQL